MAREEEITHKGRIVGITPEITTIEIISESACSACHAKGLCGMGESGKKLVEVRTSAWTPRQIGDEVEVALRKAMGYKAVFIAYGMPLIVLVTVLSVLNGLGLGELVAGLGAIGAVILCYLGIFLYRDKLKTEYAFYIK